MYLIYCLDTKDYEGKPALTLTQLATRVLMRSVIEKGKSMD
jgi:hypothetical protein